MHAAQRAAGVLAARQRGDHKDATYLMAQFSDGDELAAGSLLLAQLSLGLYARTSGRSFDEVASELSLHLEAAVAR